MACRLVRLGHVPGRPTSVARCHVSKERALFPGCGAGLYQLYMVASRAMRRPPEPVPGTLRCSGRHSRLSTLARVHWRRRIWTQLLRRPRHIPCSRHAAVRDALWLQCCALCAWLDMGARRAAGTFLAGLVGRRLGILASRTSCHFTLLCEPRMSLAWTSHARLWLPHEL